MAGIDRQHVDGALRGAIGGVAGLVAMGLFMRASRALAAGRNGESEPSRDGADGNGALDDIAVVKSESRVEESTTETVARIAYEAVEGEEPDDRARQRLGQAVHWGYGVLLGGVYGAFRGGESAPDLLGGLGYGAAAWLLGDEVMVPLLGLADGPTAHDWTEHANALGAHLAYGAATSAATQALRRLM